MRWAIKNAASGGRSRPDLACLVHQDRHPRLEIRRLHRDGQAPAETGLQALLQTLDFLRVAVAGQDHLLTALEQRIEGMEKLFLGAIFLGKKLDVVD
jgi:hypothetical protein